jgi:hypothetical protein
LHRALQWARIDGRQRRPCQSSHQLRCLLPSGLIERHTGPSSGQPSANRLRVSMSNQKPDYHRPAHSSAVGVAQLQHRLSTAGKRCPDDSNRSAIHCRATASPWETLRTCAPTRSIRPQPSCPGAPGAIGYIETTDVLPILAGWSRRYRCPQGAPAHRPGQERAARHRSCRPCVAREGQRLASALCIATGNAVTTFNSSPAVWRVASGVTHCSDAVRSSSTSAPDQCATAATRVWCSGSRWLPYAAHSARMPSRCAIATSFQRLSPTKTVCESGVSQRAAMLRRPHGFGLMSQRGMRSMAMGRRCRHVDERPFAPGGMGKWRTAEDLRDHSSESHARQSCSCDRSVALGIGDDLPAFFAQPRQRVANPIVGRQVSIPVAPIRVCRTCQNFWAIDKRSPCGIAGEIFEHRGAFERSPAYVHVAQRFATVRNARVRVLACHRRESTACSSAGSRRILRPRGAWWLRANSAEVRRGSTSEYAARHR